MNNVYYKKVGRKYIPIETYDMEGVQEGLWLILRNKHSKSLTNMLYPTLVHNLQDVGRFSDFCKAHKEELTTLISKEYENFIKEKKSFSISELTDCVLAAMSKIK